MELNEEVVENQEAEIPDTKREDAPDHKSADGSGQPEGNAFDQAYEKALKDLEEEDVADDEEKKPDDSDKKDVKEKTENKEKKPEAKKQEKQPDDSKEKSEKTEGEKPGQPGKLKAPDRWKEEQKEVFARQPEEVQKQWLEQHSEWARGANEKFEAAAEARKFQEDVEGMFTPQMRQQMQQLGVDSKQAFQQLVKFQDMFMTKPVEYIGHLLKQTNIDPRIYINGEPHDSGEQQQAGSNDLNYDQLAPILNPILDKMKALEENQAHVQQREADVQAQTIDDAISTMQSQTNEDGSLAYPYFERVANEMSEIIVSGRLAHLEPRQGLEQAYNEAIYMNPEVREEVIAAQAQKQFSALQQQTQQQAAPQKQDDFKKAKSFKPSQGNTPAKKSAGGFDAAFFNAWDTTQG